MLTSDPVIAPPERPSPATPGLAALYELFAARLQRIVGLEVQAPEAVIEDACQFAWWKLVCRGDNVRRETAPRWLATTAVREARRILRYKRHECSLDQLLDVLVEPLPSAEVIDPHQLAQARERLAAIAQVPPRQQRILWLHGLGLSYREMAAHEGCTRRTVERQLLRAKQRLRESHGE